MKCKYILCGTPWYPGTPSWVSKLGDTHEHGVQHLYSVIIGPRGPIRIQMTRKYGLRVVPEVFDFDTAPRLIKYWEFDIDLETHDRILKEAVSMSTKFTYFNLLDAVKAIGTGNMIYTENTNGEIPRADCHTSTMHFLNMALGKEGPRWLTGKSRYVMELYKPYLPTPTITGR